MSDWYYNQEKSSGDYRKLLQGSLVEGRKKHEN